MATSVVMVNPQTVVLGGVVVMPAATPPILDRLGHRLVTIGKIRNT